MTACVGSCNSRYRRAVAVYQAAVDEHAAAVARLAPGETPPDPPQPPQVQPVDGAPVWCARCAAVIRRELAELDELAAALAALPPGIRPVAGHRPDKVSVSSPHPPSPSPAADNLDALIRWLQSYEDAWREANGWESAPQRGKLSTATTACINWLRMHLDGVLATEDLAGDFGAGVRFWHRSLRAASHTESYARHVNQSCPKCRRYTLYEHVGEDFIRCIYQDCQARLTREELQAAERHQTAGRAV